MSMPLSTDTFTWNSLIHTHLCKKQFHLALSTYQHMLFRGVRPDRHTLPRIISTSRHLGSFSFGKQLHGQALKYGLCFDQYVMSALLELYGQFCGANAAKDVFHKVPMMRLNPVSWTLLAGMYVKEGKPRLTIELFNQMVQCDGVEIDSVLLATLIGACGQLKSLQEGRNAHKVARECGIQSDVLVSNSLLKMYIDCGCIKEARTVFDGMESRDAISWTEMARGYVKKGEINEGLKLFRRMIVDQSIKPDAVAIASILPACARMTAYKNGREIHGYLLRNGIDFNLTVRNALMDMYIKSGSIEYASHIFSGMKVKDIVSFTVMILGYSLHGQGKEGVELFRDMETSSGIKVDEMAYAAGLYACCSANMIEEGKSLFNCLKSPKFAHCTLMVALLARARLFDEAMSFVEQRQIARRAEVLRALLDGCRIHHEIHIGKRVVEQLYDLEPLNAENYVVLSNWYAHNANWDMVDKLRETIRDMGLRPKRAFSWIEFRNKVHVFGTGDISHPRSQSIYTELQCLMKKMEEEQGEMKSNSGFSLHDVDEERECIPIGHSELLAVSFGLISKQAGTRIRVTKNLNICHSSHDFIRFISKTVGREIIIKDQSCFHHFKNGSCSCKNFLCLFSTS